MPKGIFARKSLEERFWEKVDVRGPDECWPWKAYIAQGYGWFSFHSKAVHAHRIAYILTKGPISPALGVLHSCDNGPCCNPAHLWPGTQVDNVQDCVVKGRGNRGERNGRSKLTEAQVREARILHASGISRSEVARRMGISRTTMFCLLRGITWKHI